MREQLEFILAGAAVKRFHTIHTIHSQNIAEHSWGVAWLCYLLTDEQPRAELLIAAMEHDLPEHVTGDMPAPAKRSMNLHKLFKEAEEEAMACAGFADRELTDEELKVLKFADTVDLMLFCIRDMSMGSLHTKPVYKNCLLYVEELRPYTDKMSEMLTIIGVMYEHCKR